MFQKYSLKIVFLKAFIFKKDENVQNFYRNEIKMPMFFLFEKFSLFF